MELAIVECVVVGRVSHDVSVIKVEETWWLGRGDPTVAQWLQHWSGAR